jgi:hypothetical protein
MNASRSSIAFALIMLCASAVGAAAEPLRDDGRSQLFLPQQSSLPTPLRLAALTCGPYCATFEGGTTPIEQGSGTSCANAESNLASQLQTLARNDCINNISGLGDCDLVITYTKSCFQQSPTAWAVQGDATYHCKETSC